MFRRSRFAPGIAAGFLILAALASAEAVNPAPDLAPSAQVTTKEIEEALTCQCGCGLTVHSCNHLNCGSGIPLKREVLALVNAGHARDEILVRFREKYGEKILSAPVAEGFNLAAWILPFVAVGAGIVVIVVVVRRWTGDENDGSGGTPDALSDTDRRRLDEALRREDS